MLTGMQLENFKSWDDTGQIRLAPLTVFFGRNSSGKSSLLQSMLLMKQTAESLDQRQVLNLGGNEALVDLGTYGDMVFRHETTRDVGLTFDWIVEEPRSSRTSPYQQLFANRLGFTTIVGPENASRRLPEIVVKRMGYTAMPGANPLARVGMRRGSRHNYTVFTDGVIMEPQPTAPSSFPDPIRCYAFPELVFKSFRDAAILADLPYQFEQLLSGISYVGPLRSRPSRTYQWRGSSPSSVGPSGENTVAALLASSRIDSEDHLQGFQDTIGFWLKQMEVISTFEIEEVAPSTDLYELRVTAPGGTTPVSILDVGFGVSQVLPVLVQSFYAAKGTSVLFEQPEIHLHPAAQSVLGDALLAAVKRNKVQLLVETHSEHLLHRIQRRIAEEQITNNDVALYFVETSEGRSEIHELKVDEYGNITNWPQDFFGDEMGDLAAMTEAAAERQSRQA
jgi:predicted ATPase